MHRYDMYILYKYSFLYYWESFLLLNRYNYIDINYYIFLSIECIDMYSYNSILYWYNCIELDNDWENVKDCKDMVNGSKWDLLVCVNMVYQKIYNR